MTSGCTWRTSFRRATTWPASIKGHDAATFTADRRTVNAVAYSLVAIGEAVKHVPDDVRALASGVEWRRVAGMRDVLAHAYFSVRETVLWDVARNHLPELGRRVVAVLARLPDEGS